MAVRRRLRDGLPGFPRRYLASLRAHVRSAVEPGPGPAGRVGTRACALGITILALARIHEAALASLVFPGADGAPARRRLAARERSFFAGVLLPVEASHRPAAAAPAGSWRPGTSPDRRSVDLASARRALATSRSEHRVLLARGAVDLASAEGRLTRETGRRRVVQDALDTSEGELRVALARSLEMEEELRQLSRSLLSSHEEERKRISRELHDALGQTLTAVNVGLASMRTEAAVDLKEFRRSVARTQRLVQGSMKTVHRFARDLRPALLDDLGLVPALLAFAKEFGRKNGLPVSVLVPGESAPLDGDRRTALFRVAQEALVNVGRHAEARNVRVTLGSTAGGVSLEVWNDGRSFDVERALRSKTNRHLGLLCMRERMEMVGGTFSVRSSKEGGTTVRAAVSLRERPRG